MTGNETVIYRQTRAITRKRKLENIENKTFADKTTQTDNNPENNSKRIQCGKALTTGNPNKSIEKQTQNHLEYETIKNYTNNKNNIMIERKCQTLKKVVSNIINITDPNKSSATIDIYSNEDITFTNKDVIIDSANTKTEDILFLAIKGTITNIPNKCEINVDIKGNYIPGKIYHKI